MSEQSIYWSRNDSPKQTDKTQDYRNNPYVGDYTKTTNRRKNLVSSSHLTPFVFIMVGHTLLRYMTYVTDKYELTEKHSEIR
jgi:hypothetical protein